MAPDTAAAAPLKEHRCPYPRTVVNRETLNIKNDALAIHAAA
jgi:hypothetical protein